MSEYWLAAAIGAGIGVSMLALFVRASAKTLGDAGLIALAAMLAIYIGARLVTGTTGEIVAEMGIATFVILLARWAMTRWPPAIGAAIFLHGFYDAIVGPHTGVASWYPPLCAGWDFVVGIGLLVILHRKSEI